MSVVVQLGGSVGVNAASFPSRPILYRVALGCALLLALVAPPRADAGTLYRCTGSQGEIVYSNSTAGYRQCKSVGSYAGSSPRASTAKPKASVKKTAPPSFAAVKGSVQTDARALDAGAADRLTRFAQVAVTVESTATMLTAPTQTTRVAGTNAGAPEADSSAPAKRGEWEYHEAKESLAQAASVAGAGDRVLRGAVYKVTQADGSVEYTNLAPAGGAGHSVKRLFTYLATCMACDLHSPIRWGSVRLNLLAYADTIRAASLEFGVNEALLRAIIHAESAFNPRAMSIKGAQGLMQLMPGTAGDMGVANAFDADQNIRGGARYLGLLLKTFNGNEQLAAAAYNAGPGAVQRYRGVPPYAETQVYVQRVGTLRSRYGQALHPPLAARSQARSALQ